MKPSTTRSRLRANRLARLIAAVCVMAISACGGGGPTALGPAEGFGPFTGRWDGESWRGYGFAVVRDDSLFLSAHRPDPRYYYDEYVRVATPFAGIGTYEIAADGGRLAKMTGGDAGHFPSASGTLRVTSYEIGSGTIKGTIALVSAKEALPWTFLGAFSVPIYESFEAVPDAPCRRPAPCSG